MAVRPITSACTCNSLVMAFAGARMLRRLHTHCGTQTDQSEATCTYKPLREQHNLLPVHHLFNLQLGRLHVYVDRRKSLSHFTPVVPRQKSAERQCQSSLALAASSGSYTLSSSKKDAIFPLTLEAYSQYTRDLKRDPCRPRQQSHSLEDVFAVHHVTNLMVL